MARNTLIGFIIALILLISIAGVLLARTFLFTPEEVPAGGDSGSTFPSGGSTFPFADGTGGAEGSQEDDGSRFAVTTLDGGTIAVQDFRQSAETTQGTTTTDGLDVLYPSGPDLIYIVSGVSESHAIYYNTELQAFFVYLLEEPLSATRIDAERSLVRELAVREEDLCRLNLFVFVSERVNSFLAGENLGLPLCPGAISLP